MNTLEISNDINLINSIVNNIKKVNKPKLFYTGLASTPDTVGVEDEVSGETIEEINVSKPSGKETRKKYETTKKYLIKKYGL